MSNKIIGVTIATPEYKSLADEAAKRFRKYSGLDTCVIDMDSTKNGYESKFKLLDIFKGKRICFFDSDCFAVRNLNLNDIDFTDVAGVNDPTVLSSSGFVRKDCFTLGIPFAEYLNTGFLLLDLSSNKVISAFEIAKKFNKFKTKVVDKTEQSILNYAFQKSGCDIKMLPFEYNFFKPAVNWGYYPYIPREVINVHAAGYPLHSKKSELDNQCRFFESEVRPVSDYIEKTNINITQRRGFIVTTEDQLNLAEEAKKRAFQHLDINCEIVIAKDRQEAHLLKLKSFLTYKNEEVYVIDNDLWFIDKFKLPKLKPGQICATRSINKSIEQRSAKVGVDYEKYFCSCFVGAYVDDKFHKLIQSAIELRGDNLYDEVYFNIAVRDNNYELVVMTDRLNYCSDEFDSFNIKAIHAARKPNKFEWLNAACEKYNSAKKYKHFKRE